MAKRRNGGSERRESMRKLVERYIDGNATTDEVTTRIDGYAGYLGKIKPDEIDSETLRSIATTVKIAKYALRLIKESGKYGSLDTDEQLEFDLLAEALGENYKALADSEGYKSARERISSAIDDFISNASPQPSEPVVLEEPSEVVAEPKKTDTQSQTPKSQVKKPRDVKPAKKPGLGGKIQTHLDRDI